MKTLYLSAFLALSIPFAAQAKNDLADFASQMNALTTSAFAAVDKQMAIKINLSGKQRMLTQKMTKEALLASLKINPEENKKNMDASAALFEKTLKGLQVGDESLELTKTTDKSILAQLAKVETLWGELKTNIESVKADNIDKETLQVLAEKNLPLLKAMNKAVGMYAQISGADLNDLATVLNLSGKQRMLTQKMTKELLLIANDIDSSENQDNLKKTAELFDRTLKGLIKGDKELALPETKDENILKQLEIVQNHWDDYQPVIEKADTSEESLQKAAELNLPLLKEMNKAVKMYEVQSEK